MQDLERWLKRQGFGPTTIVFAALAAAILTLVAVACVGLLIAGAVAGAYLGRGEQATVAAGVPGTGTSQAAAQAAETALAPPAARQEAGEAQPPQPTAAVQLRETPQDAPPAEPTATPVLTGTPQAGGTSPEGDASPPEGAPPPPQPVEAAGASPASALVQYMSQSGPPASLELTPTTQLTLSSVIFVENVGQFPDGVRYQARGRAGGGVWLAPGAIWLTLMEGVPAFGQPPPGEASAPYWKARDGQQGVLLKLSFEGANPNPEIVPFEPLDTRVTYLHGDEPANWQSGVPVWGGVRYVDVYPGVDLELTGQDEDFVQRFVVHPRTDGSAEVADLLGAVRLRVEGADDVALESLPLPASGEDQAAPAMAYLLRLQTGLGEVTLPLFRLEVAGEDGEAPALPAPRLLGDGASVEAPFSVPADEAGTAAGNVVYTSLLGAGGNAGSLGVAVDGAGGLGDAYVIGYAYQPAAFSAPGLFQTSAAGSYDAFVAKIGAGGREMVYATFLGGSGDEAGGAIAVDGWGRAIVAGVTDSPDLPVTAGSFDTGYGGGLDAFVARLDASGAGLDYAGYLGGSGFDRAWAVAVDALGHAYAAGTTDSADFPITGGSWDTALDGRDAFVVKIDAGGGRLAYATLLGGGGADEGLGLAVGGVGNAYVVGTTHSPDFPTTEGAFDRAGSTGLTGAPGGDADAFVAKFNADGSGLAYATFLGGSAADYGRSVAVDGAGRATVAGSTRSADFPTTPGAFDVAHDGGLDAFLVRLNETGAGLDYGAFLGGSGDDWGQAVAVDGAGYAYLTGASPSLSAVGSPRVGGGGLGVFVARVDELGTRLAHAETLRVGLGQAVAVDRLGSVYVAGVGPSAGWWDAYAAKLVVGTPFLRLPVDDGGNFARAALGNVGDRGPGRVNSWFDHRFPNHSQNQKLARWDGVDIPFTAASPSRIGESWYDGHGGTDFRRDGWDEAIYAAAPGTVIDTVTTCQVGQTACGAYFGNRVWLDHGNGYATVYAHLKSVSVAVGDRVADPAAQALGIMGNTGRSLGTHLHFALYFDEDRDGRWTSDEVVDPYGWAGAGRDPAGGPGWYLWAEPLTVRQLVVPGMSGDAVLHSPAGYVTATLPAGAVTGAAVVELADLPPGGRPEADWHATGRGFWLRGERLPVGEAGAAPSLARPLALSVSYRDKDLVHLDAGGLTLFRWDAGRNAWDSLPTTVDQAHHRVSAETSDLGRFDLHAPLLCPADDHEPDDDPGAALAVAANGAPVTRLFDIASDVDWFRFEAEAGAVYVAETEPLGTGVGATLRLYDADSASPLAQGEGRAGGASYLAWQAPADGMYLVRVRPAEGSARGCEATYRFRLARVLAPDQVTIAGPEGVALGVTAAFTATVGPAAATAPITYTWWVSGQVAVTHSAGLSDTYELSWDTPGERQVVVTATNAAGSAVVKRSVRVYGPVVADFTASPREGEAPLAVMFINKSTGEYGRSRWQFGDGGESEAKSPTHTFQEPGVYTVTLTVSGPAGESSATRTEFIAVRRRAPAITGNHGVYLPYIVRK